MILEGTTSSGAVVPVQVTTDGKVVAEGRTGAEGPQGPAGPEGPQGPEGPAGAPGNLWSGSDPGPISYTGGSVAIGTTTPTFSTGDGLEIVRSGAACLRIEGDSGNQAVEIYADINGASIDARGIGAQTSFDIGGSTKMLLDNSGRLLVGTTSSTATETVVLQGNSGGANSYSSMLLTRGTTSIGDGNSLGNIEWSDSSHARSAMIRAEGATSSWSGTNHATKLTFHTTPDGSTTPVERMQIDSQGDVVFQGAPIIRSPDGTHWAIEVDNAGNLSAVQAI